MMELDSHSLYAVMLGMRGWSGSVDRNLSNFPLKTATVQLVRPRMSLGRQLNRRGPLKGSDENLIVLILCAAVVVMVGSTQERPRLSLTVNSIGVASRFGTWPSIILHV